VAGGDPLLSALDCEHGGYLFEGSVAAWFDIDRETVALDGPLGAARLGSDWRREGGG